MDDFRTVSANTFAEKKRFVVHTDQHKFCFDELSAAKERALTQSARITEEHCCDDEWFVVAHFVFDPRGARLQQLVNQRNAFLVSAKGKLSIGHVSLAEMDEELAVLDREIADLRKKVPQ